MSGREGYEGGGEGGGGCGGGVWVPWGACAESGGGSGEGVGFVRGALISVNGGFSVVHTWGVRPRLFRIHWVRLSVLKFLHRPSPRHDDESRFQCPTWKEGSGLRGDFFSIIGGC